MGPPVVGAGGTRGWLDEKVQNICLILLQTRICDLGSKTVYFLSWIASDNIAGEEWVLKIPGINEFILELVSLVQRQTKFKKHSKFVSAMEIPDKVDFRPC